VLEAKGPKLKEQEADQLGSFVRLFDKIHPEQLDRRELQLILLACSTILVLGAGLALLMYPVVFSYSSSMLRNAFYGFCGLSALLAVYLVDRQVTILHLRRQIAEASRRAAETKIEASAELLNAIPNLNSFKDRLAMEYRRAAAANQVLSVLVITVVLPEEVSSTPFAISLLSDAAKAISRKLRGQDSLYVLRPHCFGTILPTVSRAVAERISSRVAEGLADAAGATNRFTYKINVVNWPANAASAHELQEAVLTLLPADNSMRSMAEETL
jgi:GGDEF domain-containing protein